jgi:hypothetical protein
VVTSMNVYDLLQLDHHYCYMAPKYVSSGNLTVRSGCVKYATGGERDQHYDYNALVN